MQQATSRTEMRNSLAADAMEISYELQELTMD